MFELPDPTGTNSTEENASTPPTSPLVSGRVPAPPPAQRPRQPPHTITPSTVEVHEPDATPASLPGRLLPHRWRRSSADSSRTSQSTSSSERAHPHNSQLPDGVPSPLPFSNGTRTTTFQEVTNASGPDAHPTHLSVHRRSATLPYRRLLLSSGLSLLVLVSLLILASSHLLWLEQLGKQVQSGFSRSPQTPTLPGPTAIPRPVSFSDTTLGIAFDYPGSWTADCQYPGHCELAGVVTSPTSQDSQAAVFDAWLWPGANYPSALPYNDTTILQEYAPTLPPHIASGTYQSKQGKMAFAGVQWLQQEFSWTADGQPFHEIELVGHHQGKIYILAYYANQGDWSAEAVQDFSLILSSFHFTTS